ncbi:adenosylcobinamide-phosphate synthase CbiB [Rhabdaerophilum sp. SD176]|uniref:adenosylcobinamide-phosphate synthase CbiB n=1 Tax=Rhabdaerophilum sp. SD176 TaxID=2983548 RepID=UPI0024E02BDB|nr:adenosylcobinamide-phosphate synthase CbiB [Rhabdaerophilum sp. SD176]
MTLFPETLLIVLVALVPDALIGDPDIVWRRIPHPVAWFGGLIRTLEARLNRPEWPETQRRLLGLLALVILVAVACAGAFLLQEALMALPYGWIWAGLAGSVLIAQRSLHDHVARVADALESEGLAGGRRAVSMVVGRNPDVLDEAGVARAAIETTAENFSDGVVAPVFWFLLLGLPGLAVYKAVNTADSMIGHRSPRYLAYGWASARLDDLLNLAPARLSGLLIAAACAAVGRQPGPALRVMLRDARLHKSPNAGWPESAMAGGLGLALAGPRIYGTERVDDPYLNPGGRRDAGPADIRQALAVMAAACLLLMLIVLALTFALA